MKYSICILCASVSGLWLLLSAGVAWGYLNPSEFMLPIALLMGGSVVGIANKMPTIARRAIVIVVGMITAYLFLLNLDRVVVVIEIIIILLVAHFLFRKKGPETITTNKLKDELIRCCD